MIQAPVALPLPRVAILNRGMNSTGFPSHRRGVWRRGCRDGRMACCHARGAPEVVSSLVLAGSSVLALLARLGHPS